MSDFTTIPQDLFIHHLFPRLPLSKVVEIVEVYPSLLPIVKEYLLNLGRDIGMDNVTDAKKVLAKLHMKTDVEEAYLQFKQVFLTRWKDLLFNWVPDGIMYSYFKEEDILKIAEHHFSNIYPKFQMDWNQNLDTLFGKKILNPKVEKYIQGNFNTQIFEPLFPNTHREFYTQMKNFFSIHYFPTYDPYIFLEEEESTTRIRDCIYDRTTFAAETILYHLLNNNK
jgi:hypothetical protein